MNILESDKLKQEKEALIRRWLALEKEVEDLNARMYDLTRQIETMNIRIEETLSQEARQASPKPNGRPTS